MQAHLVALLWANFIAASSLDAVNLLEARRNSKSAVFDQAVSLLRSFENSPSCYRTAAQLLVNSCQRLDSGKGELSGDELVYYRYNYALSLAVCDLTVAKKTMAPSCDAFRESALKTLPKSENGKQIEVPKYLTDDCMEVLGSDAVLWNSFNSNKAQAMTICQASREDMEKDEILSTYRATGKVVENFNELLDLYAEEWRLENERREIANNKSFQNIFIQLNTVKDDLADLAKNFFNDLRVPLRSTADTMTAISGRGKEMETLFAALRDDIHEVHGRHVLAQRNAEAANDDMRNSVATLASEMDRMAAYMDRIAIQFATIESRSIQTQRSAETTSNSLATLQTRVTNITKSMAHVGNVTDNHKADLEQFAIMLSDMKADAGSIKLSLLGGGLSGIISTRLLGVPWWIFIISAPLAIIVGFTFYTVSLQRLFRLTGIGLLTPVAVSSATRGMGLICDFTSKYTEHERGAFISELFNLHAANAVRLILGLTALCLIWTAGIASIFYQRRKKQQDDDVMNTFEELIPYIKIEPEF